MRLIRPLLPLGTGAVAPKCCLQLAASNTSTDHGLSGWKTTQPSTLVYSINLSLSIILHKEVKSSLLMQAVFSCIKVFIHIRSIQVVAVSNGLLHDD